MTIAPSSLNPAARFSCLSIAVAALRSAAQALSTLDPEGVSHDARQLEEALERTQTVYVAPPQVMRGFLDSLPGEDAITSYITNRIDDGNMDLGDVTKYMARYGLMDPTAFALEMQERMAGDEAVEEEETV